MPCRRCNICEDMSHHWIEHIEDADLPTYTHHCKHCDAVGMMCDTCEDGLIAGAALCPACQGEAVFYVKDVPACVWCGEDITQSVMVRWPAQPVVCCSDDCAKAYTVNLNTR